MDGGLASGVVDPGEVVAIDGGLAGGVVDPGELVAMDGGLASGVVGGHEAAACEKIKPFSFFFISFVKDLVFVIHK